MGLIPVALTRPGRVRAGLNGPDLGPAYVVAPIGPGYDIVEHDLDFDPESGIPSAYPELAAVGIAVPRPADDGPSVQEKQGR